MGTAVGVAVTLSACVLTGRSVAVAGAVAVASGVGVRCGVLVAVGNGVGMMVAALVVAVSVGNATSASVSVATTSGEVACCATDCSDRGDIVQAASNGAISSKNSSALMCRQERMGAGCRMK